LKDLLHILFRFPNEPDANPAFVTSVLNLFTLPVMVMDRRMRVHLVNIQGQDMLFRFADDSKKRSDVEHGAHGAGLFPKSLRDAVRACIRERKVGFVGDFAAPGVRSDRHDLVLCPGEIQGAKFCFLLMLTPILDPESDRLSAIEAILESINGAALCLNRDLRLCAYNRRYLKEFRLTDEEAHNMRISELNPSPQSKILETQIQHLMENNLVRNSKADTITTLRRGVVLCSLLVWPLRSQNGDAGGIFVIAQPSAGSAPLSLLDDKTKELFGETAIAQGPPMFFTQLDGRIVTMNLAARGLLKGGPDSEASDLKSALPWGQPDVIDHLYADLLAGANCSALHTDLETQMGMRVFAVEARGIKEVGDITSIVLVRLVDVTEVEHSRNMLADTARRLANEKDIMERVLQSLRSVRIAYAVVDRELTVLRVSDSVARRYATRASEMVGRKFHEISPLFRKAGIIAYVKTAMERGQKISVGKIPFEFPGGERAVVSADFHPITIDGKQACLIVSENLTDIEARESELAGVSRRFRALLENLEEGVAILDRNGDVVDANHVIYGALRMTHDEVIGKNEREIMMIEEGDLLVDFRRRALKERRPVRTGCIKLTSKLREGTLFADIVYVPLIGREGTVEETLAVVRYLTDVKNLEKKVEDYTNNLQRLVRERTAEITSANRQLGATVEKLASMARSGLVLSSLKDMESVMDGFLEEACEVLDADFASVALITSGNGSSRTTFYTRGEQPPPGAVPSEVVEQNLARLTLGETSKPDVPEGLNNLLVHSFSFSNSSGLLLAWKANGEFSAIDRNLSGLLATQLNFALPVTTYVSDLRLERDRSQCLRRIAFRTAAAESVASAITIVAEELSRVMSVDRFYWMVAKGDHDVWLNEIPLGVERAANGRIHLSGEEIGCMGSLLAACRESHREFCESFPDFGEEGFKGEAHGPISEFDYLSGRAGGENFARCFKSLLLDRNMIRHNEGSIAVAPVMLSERSYGMLCAYNEIGVPFKPEESCFMCLAASTVGHMWEAADASRSVRRFEAEGETLGEIAHDLKYPLSRVRDILQRIRSGRKAGRKDLKALDEITSEIKTLNMLAEELIDISDRKGRKTELLDLRDLVGRCIALMSDEASGPRIVLDGNSGPPPPLAFANRKDVKNILIGVLANSVEAAGEDGWVRVAVESSDSGQAGSFVNILVTDSGPGVPEDLRTRVFDAFFSTKSEGRGVGLFSAKKRANANGGDLSCEPGENGKSRFVITLPAA
jgi:PAS domain S-box-containing protein